MRSGRHGTAQERRVIIAVRSNEPYFREGEQQALSVFFCAEEDLFHTTRPTPAALNLTDSYTPRFVARASPSRMSGCGHVASSPKAAWDTLTHGSHAPGTS